MAKRSRLQLLLAMPSQIAREWRAINAWSSSDWPRMIEQLQPIVARGVETDGDLLLLGLAYTRLGQWDQAIWYFGQITSRFFLQREQLVYGNTYAYALVQAGRLGEAQEHLRGLSREKWPKSSREWSERLLAASPESGDIAEDEVVPRSRFH